MVPVCMVYGRSTIVLLPRMVPYRRVHPISYRQQVLRIPNIVQKIFELLLFGDKVCLPHLCLVLSLAKLAVAP